MMAHGSNLLADYVQNGSEAAFRELVGRYADLVYSVAIRLLDGDKQLAEDVAQTVFIDLARLARTFPKEVMLGGWLHRHTCFTASNAIRKERRLKNREQTAMELRALDDSSEPQWTQIAPGEDGEARAVMRFPSWEFSMAYLDTAFTEKEENAYCAFVRFGVFADSAGRPKVMLAAAWRDRPTLRQLAHKVLESCRRGKVDVLVVENRAGAEWVKQELQRLMDVGEFSIVLDEPRGDKVARLHSVSPLFEDRMVFAPDRKWAEMVIDEVSQFPKGRWKDLTDCCSGGLGYLRRSGLIRLAQEYDDDERESRTWKGSRATMAERYGV